MNTAIKIYKFLKRCFKRFAPRRVSLLVEQYKIGIKYVISGGTAAVVDLGLLFLLTEIAGIWYLLSAVIAFICSLFTAFLLHKFWTFREHSLHRITKQFVFFTLVALFNLGLNTLLLYLAVEVWHVWYLAAQFVIMGALAFMNFVINKTVTFRHENKDGKNILIATGIFPPDIGGPATYTKILSEELPKLGWEVKVVTYSDEDIKTLKHKNIKTNDAAVFQISRKQHIFLRYFQYFWQVLKLLNWANIVYAQGPVSEGLPTYWACKLRGRKYVLKIVGDYAWEQMQVSRKQENKKTEKQGFISLDEFQNKKFDARTERKRRIEILVARNADKVIVPSQYLKKIVKGWGVKENKINVIYNAAEFKSVSPLPKPENEKWLVSVGRFVPWKGMDTLIDIMPSLIRSEPALKLIIIGEGPEQEKLKIKSEKLKIEGQIKMLGRLGHEQTLAYIKAADVFVLNTGYEGLSHVLVETLYLGTPVVTTNVGGNPEVIKNGINGLLVEYNNQTQLKEAILRLLNSQELARQFVLAGRQDLTKFSQKKMIADAIAVINY